MSVVRLDVVGLYMMLLLLVGGGACGSDIEILRDLPYGDEHPARCLDLFRPLDADVPVPVVLALHGGNWIGGGRRDLDALARRLASQGYAVACMGYRFAPEAIFPAQRDDARAAARWLQAQAYDYGLDADRLFVLGVSAGGQLAALLALDPDPTGPAVRGVITLAAPMDLTGRTTLREKAILYTYLGAYYEDAPDIYRNASPITYVSATAPPWLIMHGTRDSVIPPMQAEEMARALEAVHVPVTLVRLVGASHAFPLTTSPAGRALDSAILAFLAQWSAVSVEAMPL